MKNKKAFLDGLYYKVGKQQFDFFLCGTYKKGEETLFTKWKKYSECIFPVDFDGTSDDWKVQKFFEQINQRQIFPNEVVLDLEEKHQLKPIAEELSNWDVDFKVYSTGSRGYHIHIFFKKEVKNKLKIIRYFGADEQKADEKTMIALENTPHFKGKGIKKEVEVDGRK